MALEIRESSKWWYGSWVVNGRKTVVNLGVPITGKRPASERCSAMTSSNVPGAGPRKRMIARAYLDVERDRGVSPSTWNYSLELLRTTFKRLHPQLPHGQNPIREFVTKAADTVSRVPFTPTELKAIQEACAQDDFIRPVVITGMCTAMRRGDCCCLKWSDVDLKEGFISLKTSKTGEKVDIPLFPLLREELERIKATAGGSGYCFPKAAEMYHSNPDGISVRVKQVLARAFEQNDVAEGRLLAPWKADVRRIRELVTTLPM